MVVPVLSHAKPFPSGRLQTHTETHAPSNTEPVPYQKPLCTKKHSQVSLPSADTRTVDMQTHTQAHGHVSFDRDLVTLSTHRHAILHTHTHVTVTQVYNCRSPQRHNAPTLLHFLQEAPATAQGTRHLAPEAAAANPRLGALDPTRQGPGSSSFTMHRTPGVPRVRGGTNNPFPSQIRPQRGRKTSPRAELPLAPGRGPRGRVFSLGEAKVLPRPQTS